MSEQHEAHEDTAGVMSDIDEAVGPEPVPGEEPAGDPEPEPEEPEPEPEE